MASDFSLEAKRQLAHAASAAALATGLLVNRQFTLAFIVVGVLLLYVVPRYFPRNPLSRLLIVLFERERDIAESPFRGAITFSVGIFIASLIAPPAIAAGAVLVHGFGDAAATLVGKYLGRHRMGTHKTVEGAFAYLFFGAVGASLTVSPGLAALLAVCGMLLELVSPINDNLLIPPVLALLPVAPSLIP